MTYRLMTLDELVFISKMGIVVIIPLYKVRFLFNHVLLKHYIFLSFMGLFTPARANHLPSSQTYELHEAE